MVANECLLLLIKLMNWQSNQAEENFKKTGKITVIVQDQGSIHVSKLTKSHYKKWEKQGLYIFLLPSYSPELNRIENEWQRLKEDEYELALAVIEAIELRQKSNGLEVKRFRFS